MNATPVVNVHVRRREQTSVLTVSGEVDHEDAEALGAAWAAVDRAAMPRTAIDLTGVTFADSMLLNALLDARRRHESDGRSLVLLGPLRPAVSRLLSITGTLAHFTVVDTGSAPDAP